MLVTAVSGKAFATGVSLLRRGRYHVTVRPPPEISRYHLRRRAVSENHRGSIVGTRSDLAECLRFGAEGKVKVTYKKAVLEDINSICEQMNAGGSTVAW